MKMYDVDEEIETVATTPQEDQDDSKVKNYLKQLASGKIENPTKNSNSKFVNFKEESNVNYYDIDTLPTGYKLYPEGTKIVARPLKVLEIKKLTAITEYNADSIINDVLRKCIRGIDINDLYVADKLYILFWLRANSFRDNKYTVDFVCDKCHKDSTYHFHIGNVNIDRIKPTYDPKKVIELDSGDGVTIKYLTLKDEVMRSSFRDKYYDIIRESGEDVDDEVLSIAFMINTINGKEYDPLEKYEYVIDLDPQDYSTIVTYIEENSMGIKTYLTVKCELCGGESPTGLSFQPDFFFPKARTR